jgi:cell division protein FtsB
MASADRGLGGLVPQLRGRAVQYLLVFLGSVLVIDALVGDKGVLQMLKKRQDLRTLDQSVAAARARNDLGLIKRGAKLFNIRDAPPADKRPGDK